jgi:hypothetical protein
MNSVSRSAPIIILTGTLYSLRNIQTTCSSRQTIQSKPNSTPIDNPNIMSKVVVPISAGAAAGAAELLLTYPLDLYKTLLQDNKTVGSFKNTFKRIVKSEGIKGVYNGLGPPLKVVPFVSGALFIGNEIGLTIASKVTSKPENELGVLSRLCAGAFSALPETLTTNIPETIKIRMQLSQHSAQAKTETQLLKDIVRGGVKELSRGFTVLLFKNAAGNMMFFTGEHVYTSQFNHKGDSLVGGGIGGALAMITNNPLDIINTRIKNATECSIPKIGQVASEIISEGGILNLWVGVGPRVARAIPGGAVMFCVYGNVKEVLENVSKD